MGVSIASFPGRKKMNGLVLTACVLMHMPSFPQNLGNPVISVNYRKFTQPENEASLDARPLQISFGLMVYILTQCFYPYTHLISAIRVK